MKIDRKQFVEVLRRLSPALGINKLVPEFQYYQIEGNHIQAFNGVMLADTLLPMDLDFACAIPKELLDLLVSLEVDEVDLVVTEDEIEVRTSKLEGKFAILPEPKFQTLGLLAAENAHIIDAALVDDIIEGLNFCAFGVSDDATAGPLCGVQINRNTLYSTDRYRVVRWSLGGDSGIKCSVPPKFIHMLKRYQDEIDTLGYIEDDQLIAILNDEMYISSCVLEGEYREVEQYFPNSDNYEHVEFGEEFVSAVERHLVLLKTVDPLDRETTIKIADGSCILISRVPEKSNLVENIPVTVDKNTVINFVINLTFLREVVSRCKSFKYFVDDQKSDNGLVLFETDKLRYLLRARG